MKKINQRQLSRDKICSAALEIINVAGLEGLSMRHLAAHLHVEAASLYNHVKDKSELLDLIQENLFKQLPSPKCKTNWKKYLWELANSMRNGLLKYPKVVPLFATRPSINESALERVEEIFDVLLAAGFKYSDIMFAYKSLFIFVLGHLQAEVGHVPGAMEECEPSFAEVLEPKKFPHVMKAYSKIGGKNYYDGWFKFGISAIIDGLEYILEKSKRKISCNSSI